MSPFSRLVRLASIAAACVAAIALHGACQTRCSSNFDCGEGGFCSLGRCETECFVDEDCRSPIECRHNPAACQPKGARCNSFGRCTGSFSPPGGDGTTPTVVDVLPEQVDGWDSPPGTGYMFIADRLAIAESERGFDLDGACDGSSCIDNILWPMGEIGNDTIRQGLATGESLVLIELAGIDDDYSGEDATLTLKVYGARDADDPVDPSNNFFIPPGQTSCCAFELNPSSVYGTRPQAVARAPAKIEGGVLRSLVPVSIEIPITIGQPPYPDLKLARVYFTARVASDLSRLSDGLFGGAILAGSLAQIRNPYCTSAGACSGAGTGITAAKDSTLLDLATTLLGPYPDIDLDGDGLECFLDMRGAGRVDRCCDGTKTGPSCSSDACNGQPIESETSGDPTRCPRNPAAADGYSVGMEFTAVRARVVGVGQ